MELVVVGKGSALRVEPWIPIRTKLKPSKGI